jgi:hypothetical protein
MKSPQFLVVGTARAGTTSLNAYLCQHPGVFLPKIKEPCFFCFDGEKLNYKKGSFAFRVKGWENYIRLFDNAEVEQIRGEISTPYLFLYEKTIQNIKKYISNRHSVKILILLRNPVERAYSQYMWRIRDGREELSFDKAVMAEKAREKEGYSIDYMYASRGLYYKQVKAYLDNFDDVKIVLFEQLKSDPARMLSAICNFLDVDDTFQFTRQEELNSSSVPASPFLSKLITTESRTKFRILNQLPVKWRQGIREQFNSWNTSRKSSEPVSPDTWNYLYDYFSEDITRLEHLTGMDLSAWRSKAV